MFFYLKLIITIVEKIIVGLITIMSVNSDTLDKEVLAAVVCAVNEMMERIKSGTKSIRSTSKVGLIYG